MLAQKCNHCKTLNNYLAVYCRNCETTLYNSTNELTNKDGQEIDENSVYRVDSRNIKVQKYFKQVETHSQDMFTYG